MLVNITYMEHMGMGWKFPILSLPQIFDRTDQMSAI